MHIAILTHAEAADAAVFANLARHLLQTAAGHVIAHMDRPDVGAAEVLPPLPVSKAAQVFGAPSTAAAAALPTAPVTSIPPLPAPSVPALPSVPVAAAPVAPAAPPSPAASDTKVDKAGLPWDERIHASSKVFIADGTWRQKRGVDKGVLAAVEAELRQVMNLPAPAPAAAPAPVAPPPPMVNSVFAAGAVAAGLPPPPLLPPAAPEVGGDPTDFAGLMMWLTPHMPHKLSPEVLNAVLNTNGVPSLNALISRPDLVPVLVPQLKPYLA